MAEFLHEVVNAGMESSYDRNETVKKSSEPPWMTPEIRKLIKTRWPIFREEKRSAVWKKLKQMTRRKIKEHRKKYNEEKKNKILSGGVNRFHECVLQ